MRKDKWSDEQKQLCDHQQNLISNHVNICQTCKTSFEEYKHYGISSTPPCNKFSSELNSHIQSCNVCNQANQKWNDDGIDITPEMRTVVGSLKQGKIPDVNILRKVASHLFNELELTSSEIKDISEKADKAVRKSLEDEK